MTKLMRIGQQQMKRAESMDWKADFDNVFSDVLRKRNLLRLMLLWLGGILLCVAYGTLCGPPGRCEPYTALPVVTLQENETGAVVAQRQAVQAESQISYRVMFDNLCAENSTAGVFKTASGKHIRIDNLQVAFDGLPSDSSDGVRLRDFYDLFSPRRHGHLEASQLGILNEFGAEAADWSVRLDLANAMEVQIRSLDWRVGDGAAPSLRVQCRHARLRGDTPYITLRGHAIVQTHGATLESNHIEMNVRDECLVVRGRYLLTRGGRREAGFGACFDRALRPVDAQLSNTGENRRWANGLPHGAF